MQRQHYQHIGATEKSYEPGNKGTAHKILKNDWTSSELVKKIMTTANIPDHGAHVVVGNSM